MFVLRLVLLLSALFFGGLLLAFLFTRDRRYLRIAWLGMQMLLALLVAFGLFYVFERVLLML